MIAYTMDELVAQYRRIEADADALAKEQDEAMKPYKEALATIKNFCLLKLDEQGEKSIKTNSGTVYISAGIKAKVDNREVLLDHCREHDSWELLDLGVLIEPVKDYLDKSGGQAPPGVKIESWRRCNIRK